MADPIPSDAKQFRTAVIPGAIFIFVLGVVLAGCLDMVNGGVADIGPALVFEIVVAIPLSFLFSWLISVYFPVSFSQEGIHAYSFWGLPRFIRWQDIATVRKFNLFNLTWLRLYSSTDRNVTWLSVFQSRPVEFQNEIRKFAPSNNPLLRQFN
jgi:hypothetical protein